MPSNDLEPEALSQASAELRASVLQAVHQCQTPEALWQLARRYHDDNWHGARALKLLVTEGRAWSPTLVRHLFAAWQWRAPMATNVHLLGASRDTLFGLVVTLKRYGNGDGGAELPAILGVPGYVPAADILDILREMAMDWELRKKPLGHQAALGLAIRPEATEHDLGGLLEAWCNDPAVEAAVVRHPHFTLRLCQTVLDWVAESLSAEPVEAAIRRHRGFLEGLVGRADYLALDGVRCAMAPIADASPLMALALYRTAPTAEDRWHWFSVWARQSPDLALAALQQARAAGAAPPPREAVVPLFACADAAVRQQATLDLVPWLGLEAAPMPSDEIPGPRPAGVRRVG